MSTSESGPSNLSFGMILSKLRYTFGTFSNTISPPSCSITRITQTLGAKWLDVNSAWVETGR